MTPFETSAAIREAIRQIHVGETLEDAETRFVRNLRVQGLEILPIPALPKAETYAGRGALLESIAGFERAAGKFEAIGKRKEAQKCRRSAARQREKLGKWDLEAGL